MRRIFLGIALAMFLAFLLWQGTQRAVAQSSPTSFSIVAINDIHHGTGTNPASLQKAKNWIIANHSTAWNVQGVISNGDESDTPLDPDSSWSTIASAFTEIYNTGIPVLINPGNHDATWQTSVSAWNTFLAPLNAMWSPLTSTSKYANPGAHPVVNNANNFLPIDVVLSGVTYKFAMVGLNYQATATDIATVRGWMDAATDRQFVIGTHMFITDPTLNVGPVHPCVYGELACTSKANADPGTLDGAGILAGLKDNPRISAITSAHWHLSAQTTLVGTNGNLIAAVQGRNVGNNGYGNILILKFTPDTNSLQVYAWKTSNDTANAAETNIGNSGVANFSWQPIPATIPPPIVPPATLARTQAFILRTPVDVLPSTSAYLFQSLVIPDGSVAGLSALVPRKQAPVVGNITGARIGIYNNSFIDPIGYGGDMAVAICIGATASGSCSGGTLATLKAGITPKAQYLMQYYTVTGLSIPVKVGDLLSLAFLPGSYTGKGTYIVDAEIDY